MRKRKGIGEIRPGMLICGIEKGNKPSFFMNNVHIKNEKDIKMFQELELTVVYVEEGKHPGGGDPPPMPAGDAPAFDRTESIEHPLHTDGEAAPFSVESLDMEVADDVTDTVPFEEEINNAKQIRIEAQNIITTIMSDIRMGKTIKSEQVNDLIGNMVDSIFRNRDALTSLARLKDFDNYTFVHSVNVCTLSLAMGRSMGFNKERLHSLGVGCILHDIGKMHVPDSILNKPDRLTDEEFGVMKKHPEYGVEILSDTNGIREESLYSVVQHHEKYDGSGYPNGIKGDEIHTFAILTGVVDVYDAMTSKRVYHNRFSPSDVLQRLYQWRGTHFAPNLVERFIKCLGIYPIGSVVEFDTAEVGVVVSVNHGNLLRPKVLLVLDRDKHRYISPFTIDLSGTEAHNIVSAVPPERYNIEVDRLLG